MKNKEKTKKGNDKKTIEKLINFNLRNIIKFITFILMIIIILFFFNKEKDFLLKDLNSKKNIEVYSNKINKFKHRLIKADEYKKNWNQRGIVI